MGKKNKVTLKGRMLGAPRVGFNLGGTRRTITEKLLSFVPAGEKTGPFQAIINCEINEEGDLEVNIRATHFLMQLGGNPLKDEGAVCDLLEELQTHCGIGEEEEAGPGILRVAYFTDLAIEEE